MKLIMKKKHLSIGILLIAFLSVFSYAAFANTKPKTKAVKAKSIYDLKIKSLDGKSTIHLKDFKGKKILLVNTASKCGFTKQYEGLQKLQDQYKDKLVIIGFPCNQFNGQEPGTSGEIAAFCKKNYGLTFLLTEKIDVNGPNQHPIYQWLTKKENNGVKDVSIGWNFGKFLIDEKGNFVEYFPSKVEPLSSEIVSML